MSNGSEIFRGIIEESRKQLLLDHEKSSAFGHSGIKGNERAAAFAEFLRQRLPDFLEVTKGEAIDCFDNRTGELDICVYDKLAARPISEQREHTLIPCESIYVVIEVKSLLNKDEVRKCLIHADRIRKLRPFKHEFVDARTHGAPASKEGHRCLYVVVAYASDIGTQDWMKKEYSRLLEVAEEECLRIKVIDRLFVVDRGIISPVRAQGRLVEEGPEYLLAELFIHLIDFIERERSRRPPIEWDIYALPQKRRWHVIRR